MDLIGDLAVTRIAGQDPRDLEALAQAMEEDGCVFVTGLLPEGALRALRDLVRRTLDESAESGATIDEAFLGLQRAAAPSSEMEAIRHHPALLRILGRLLGAHFRSGLGDIVRVQRAGRVTGPHQDANYYRGGRDLLTVWFPLEDCPPEAGSLALIPGSHRGGLLPHDDAQGGGKGIVPPPSGPWHTAAMRPGDALFFHALTVHRSLPTAEGSNPRISVDFRYGAALPPGERRGPGR